MQKLKNLLTLFKSKISLNVLAFLGLLSIFVLALIIFTLFFVVANKNFLTVEFALIGYIGLLFYLYKYWLIFFVIDLISTYKIKNKFILENKVYNIFWIIGFTISIFIIVGILIGCYDLIFH